MEAWWNGRGMGCPKCGSWAVRADRGLAGRMVCARCGEPLGIGSARRIASGTRRRGQGLWLMLGSLLTVSALLASVPERPSRPPERRGADLTRGPVLLRPSDPGSFGVVAIR